VLNTLDHNFKVEPHNPNNILTKFFSSMKTTQEENSPVISKNIKNILLISIQPLNVLHNIIEYFISLEKEIRPKEEVIIYTISSLTLYNEVNTDLKKLINSYGKHTFIDLSLSIVAIELFKRRKLVNIYKTEDLHLYGIDKNLLNHHDKVINTEFIIQNSPELLVLKNQNSPELSKVLKHKLYVPKISKNTINLKNITEFLDRNNKSDECFAKRLVPLIPKYNYRIYDKLETFALKSQNLQVNSDNFKDFYNVLIINTLNLSFKNILYISILNWNLIFITLDPEKESTNSSENQSTVEYVYEKLSEIYNNKSFNASRDELKKLNPDYSLLRNEEELIYGKKLFETHKQGEKNFILKPHIVIDTLCGIKSYLKKLESGLEVDSTKLNMLEI
jgi:hypothetical protein